MLREDVLLDVDRAKLESDAVRIRTFNETMQAEARAEYWRSSVWRPFWGLVSAIAFFLQAAVVTYLMVKGGDSVVIRSFGSLSVFWTMQIAILGVSAWHRGMEKRVRVEGISKARDGLRLPVVVDE